MGVGTREDALRDIREVIRLTPDSYLGYVSEGRYWKEAGNFEIAQKSFSKGLARLGDGDLDKKRKDEINLEIMSIQSSHLYAEPGPQINHESTPPQRLHLLVDTSFSTLPLDIFAEILSLASASMEAPAYTSLPTPLLEPPKKNFLISAMSVSRAWYRTISNTPQFWETLKLDGVLNQSNWEFKIIWWTEKLRKFDRREINFQKGLKRLVITAAGDTNLASWLEVIGASCITHCLEELVISFVDNATDVDDIAYKGASLEAFLRRSCRRTIKSLTWCSDRPLKVYNSLPDPDLDPRLQHLNIYSPGHPTERASVFRLLRPSSTRNMDNRTSPLSTLCVHATLISNYAFVAFKAPKLRHVEIHNQQYRPAESDTWANSLSGLDGLKVLDLTFLSPSDFVVWSPHKLRNLKELSINGAELGRQLLKALIDTATSLSQLTRLRLMGIKLSRNFEELKYLNCPSLLHLSLSGPSSIFPPPPYNLVAFPFLPELLSLEWRHSYLDSITQFMKYLPSRAPKLRELNLDFSRGLTIKIFNKYFLSRLDALHQNSSLHSESGEEARKTFPVLDQLSLIYTGFRKKDLKELEQYVTPGGIQIDNDDLPFASYLEEDLAPEGY